MDNKLLDNFFVPATKKEENFCKGSKTPQNIVVILPVCNQEVSIGSLILLTKLYASSIVVVDDGSSDRTKEIAKKAGVIVAVHETTRGRSAAFETGFKAAAALRADIIVTMDSQGRHNPEDIPKLVAPIIQGNADIVNGSRYLNDLGKKVSIYRRVGQNILERFTSLNSGLRITDPQSGFLAFSASAKDNFQFNSQEMEIESNMFSDAEKAGLRIKEIEIGITQKLESPVRNPIKYISGIIETIVKDIEINKPLYFYSVPGFALATCALYMGFRFLEAFLLGFKILSFGPAFIMVFLALAGAYMTITGIVIHSLRETAQPESAL